MPKGFQKGVVTNPKGKIPGTLNKSTKDIKEAYRLLIEKNLDNLTKWLEQIAEKDPAKAIMIISDLSEYVIPKLARTDLTTGDEPFQQININVTAKDKIEKLKDFINGGKPQ